MGIQEDIETRLSQKNKLLLDAITTHMEKKLDSIFGNWAKELKRDRTDHGRKNQRREPSDDPKRRREPFRDKERWKEVKPYSSVYNKDGQGRKPRRLEEISRDKALTSLDRKGSSRNQREREFDKRGTSFPRREKTFLIGSSKPHQHKEKGTSSVLKPRRETHLDQTMVEPKGGRVAERSNDLGRNDGSPRGIYPKQPMLTSKATPLSLTNLTPALPSERTSLLQVLGDDLPRYGPKKPYQESMVPCVGSFTLPPKKEELPPQEIHACVTSYAMGDLLVREAHGADLMGHFGIAKTFTNKSKVPPHGLRIPFSIPMHSLGEISMNLLVGLARKSTEIMGLDRTSRMEPHYVFHKADASHIASLFPKDEVRLQALPVSKTLPAILHVIANKSLGTWDACLFHDECVYEPMWFSFKFSLLQAYDGVNPIPPLDLTSFLLSARGILHRKRRAGVIIRVPNMARYNLEEIMRQYTRRTLRRTHDQADHLNNQGGPDLRTSLLQEGEDDAIKRSITPSESREICEVKSNDIVTKESLRVPKEPLTRLWTKRLRDVAKDASKDVPCKKLGPPPWFHSNLHEQPMGRRLNTRKNSRKDNKDQTRQAATTADGRQDELTLKDDNLQGTFLQKESLSTKRHANLMPRSDSSFKVSKKIKNNDRHFKSRGKYNKNPVFKVTNLLSFSADELDLRSNPLQEGEDDVILTKDQRHKEQLGKQGHEREATTKGQGTREAGQKETRRGASMEREEANQTIKKPMTRSKTKALNGAMRSYLRSCGTNGETSLVTWPAGTRTPLVRNHPDSDKAGSIGMS